MSKKQSKNTLKPTSQKAVDKLLKQGNPVQLGAGDKLYLKVTGVNAGSWFYRTVKNGKTSRTGLGSARKVSLFEARLKAAHYKIYGEVPEINNTEINMMYHKLKTQNEIVTFDDVAETYIEIQKHGWKNFKHSQQWANTLKKYASPVIGHLPPSEITTDHMLQILAPIWNTKNETAKRVRNRVELILNAAKVRGLREGDNVAAWRGHLEFLLTRQRDMPREHHAALPWNHIQEFWKELSTENHIGALCLKLIILTATRTAEAIGAHWHEFDIENKIWTIPAHRMKGKKEHQVPLSEAVIKLLESIPRDNTLLFPSKVKPQVHISNMAMLMNIRRINEARIKQGKSKWVDPRYNRRITVHGFRSTFRDWAAENTPHANIVVEQALAHSIGNAVEAAYRRGNLLEKRITLMEEWGNYVSGKKIKPNTSNHWTNSNLMQNNISYKATISFNTKI